MNSNKYIDKIIQELISIADKIFPVYYKLITLWQDDDFMIEIIYTDDDDYIRKIIGYHNHEYFYSEIKLGTEATHKTLRYEKVTHLSNLNLNYESNL